MQNNIQPVSLTMEKSQALVTRLRAYRITLDRLEFLLHNGNLIAEIFMSEFGFISPIPWGQQGFTNHAIHLLVVLYPRYNIQVNQVHEVVREQYRTLTVRANAILGRIQHQLINAEEEVLEEMI